MEIKLYKNESLYGVKIFDGIDKETGKPYCQPAIDADSKKIYETGGIVNYYDGNIIPCKSGFHFSMTLQDAFDYKDLFSLYKNKKYSKAMIIHPVYYVAAVGKIKAETYWHNGENKQKYVTNKLKLGRLFGCDEIINYSIQHGMINSYAVLNKPISVTSHQDSNSKILFPQSYTFFVTIDNIALVGNNYTIFSNSFKELTVENKTEYTHYVNRYLGAEQYITPIPRHTTIQFEQCDKVGKVIKNVKE